MISETGTGAHAINGSGRGSSAIGDAYSIGASRNIERAFGAPKSCSVLQMFGPCFINHASGTDYGQEIEDLAGKV
jgi:hypothetical protein